MKLHDSTLDLSELSLIDLMTLKEIKTKKFDKAKNSSLPMLKSINILLTEDIDKLNYFIKTKKQ